MFNSESKEEKKENAVNETVICGRNPVMELIRTNKEIDKILVAFNSKTGTINAILEKARAKKIPIREVSKTKLDFLTQGNNHQGIAAVIAARNYCSVDDILNEAAKKNQDPFIIICDGVEDPHNLGAIIRTAEAAGVHGIIIPKNRSASLNATVAKASSGAIEYVNVARVVNITDTIKYLKEKGVWIYGADMDGENATDTSLLGSIGIVVGNEGNGISRLVKENCDGIVKLPMFGKINSLNVSVAAGVLMYEVIRQRNKK